MNLERINIDVIIPKIKVIKKDPFTSFQNDENLNFKINLSEFVFMDFIESISSSYMPVIKAIVPPETPGIISATPMKIPFKYKSGLIFINYFVWVLTNLNKIGEKVAVITAKRIICCSNSFVIKSRCTPISAIAIIKLNLAESKKPPASMSLNLIFEKTSNREGINLTPTAIKNK